MIRAGRLRIRRRSLASMLAQLPEVLGKRLDIVIASLAAVLQTPRRTHHQDELEETLITLCNMANPT